MRVSAVVVNHHGADHLQGCLDALLAQDHADLEVVVVDNASTDASLDVLERYRDRVRVIANRENRGFAGGANDGIAATTSDAVLTCNPDVRPRPDYVRRAVAALAADPGRGAVQGKLLRMATTPDGVPLIDSTGHVAFRTRLFRNRGEAEPDRGQWEHPGPVFGVSGALGLYRRSMLKDVAIPIDGRARREIFDEDLFAFWEDVDLDWRAQMRGWEAWYEPAAVADHERGGAGPRRTPFVEELNWRNRLLTVLKCDDPHRLVPVLPGVVVTTVLKTGELALTVPSAFVAAMRHTPAIARRVAAKRHAVHTRATVPSAAVVARWFEPFDYGAWVATWWRRVRGAPIARGA